MVNRTLIPQFSIRWLLALTAACALVFSIFALAVQEYLATFKDGCWASGITIAIISLAGVLILHAMAFGVVWAFAEVTSVGRRRKSKVGQSPFRPYRGPAGRLPDKPDEPDEPATPIILE